LPLLPPTVTVTVVVWLNVPLVPFTVTLYVPLLVLLATVIVSVDFPEVEIEVGLKLAVKPVGALADSMTMPVNPLRAVIVIVEVPRDPLLMLRDAGDAEIEKSGDVTCTVMVVVWLNETLVPVTVTGYFPAAVLDGTVIVNVDELDPPDETTSEDELRDAFQPVGAAAASVTVPLNPLSDVTVIVELPEAPAWIVKADGEAEIE